MDENEAILEAFRLWETMSHHASGSDLYEEPTLLPFDAFRALRTVEARTANDPFWTTANWGELTTKFVAYANSKLVPKGSSYTQVMAERARQQHSQTA